MQILSVYIAAVLLAVCSAAGFSPQPAPLPLVRITGDGNRPGYYICRQPGDPSGSYRATYYPAAVTQGRGKDPRTFPAPPESAGVAIKNPGATVIYVRPNTPPSIFQQLANRKVVKSVYRPSDTTSRLVNPQVVKLAPYPGIVPAPTSQNYEVRPVYLGPQGVITPRVISL